MQCTIVVEYTAYTAICDEHQPLSAPTSMASLPSDASIGPVLHFLEHHLHASAAHASEDAAHLQEGYSDTYLSSSSSSSSSLPARTRLKAIIAAYKHARRYEQLLLRSLIVPVHTLDIGLNVLHSVSLPTAVAAAPAELASSANELSTSIAHATTAIESASNAALVALERVARCTREHAEAVRAHALALAVTRVEPVLAQLGATMFEDDDDDEDKQLVARRRARASSSFTCIVCNDNFDEMARRCVFRSCSCVSAGLCAPCGVRYVVEDGATTIDERLACPLCRHRGSYDELALVTPVRRTKRIRASSSHP